MVRKCLNHSCAYVFTGECEYKKEKKQCIKNKEVLFTLIQSIYIAVNNNNYINDTGHV